MLRWLVWLIPIAVLVGAGSHARAQDSDRETLDRAREHMERGQELYIQQRYAEAAEAFQEAHAVRPFAAFLYNAGVAYENAGNPGQAAEFFTRYLEAEPNATDRVEVRERIARLQAEALAQAQAPPDATEPPVTTAPADPEDVKSLLSIETNPEGAVVTLRAGRQIVARGASPFVHTMDPGEYDVVVEHPDYRTVEETIRIRPGQVYMVIVEMSQGQFLGYLRVVTQPPGAQVFLDDRSEGAVGTTPYQNVISTGEHRVWIERPGFRPEERTFNVGLGENVTIRFDITRVSHGRLRVVANIEGAQVLVDGQVVGAVPYEGDVAAGNRRVVVRADGMKDWEEDVTIRQGQVTPTRVRLRPAMNRSGAWVTSVLAAGFVSAGIVLGVRANRIEDDLTLAGNQGLLTTNDSRLTRGKIFSISADVAFGLGAILGALSIYYFLRDPLPDSEGRILEPRDWGLAPQLTPTTAGASAWWNF